MEAEAEGKLKTSHSSYLEAVWTRSCTAPLRVSLAGEGGSGCDNVGVAMWDMGVAMLLFTVSEKKEIEVSHSQF